MARSSGRSAALVGAGIFLSRIAGLIRQRVFAHYLGLSDEAYVLTASFSIPNLLQKLLGEGALSASFIPVYARLVAEEGRGRPRARGAVANLLALVVAIIVALGVVLAPQVVSLLVPGFIGDKRELTIELVRILFPATALLVMSAWCLGILNSHGKFFLSYTAPVVWNATLIVVTLAVAGRTAPPRLVIDIAWAAVAGSLLQLLVQLPSTIALTRGLRLSMETTQANVGAVMGNFGPALMGRGVNQVSAYVDAFIASLLGQGAVAAISSAQMLYTLPVSLFGMSVSAAELPAMSAATGEDRERHAVMRRRLEDGQHRIAFFVVPCAALFLGLGDVVAGAVFQSGRFSAQDGRYVGLILAGSAVGLLASTLSRLSSSTFYALGDTRTPLRYALVRVLLTTGLGVAAALLVPPLLGIDRRWGAVGLSATAGLSAWVEYLLLRRRLATRIGPVSFRPGYLPRLWIASVTAVLTGWTLLYVVQPAQPLVAAALALGPYALVYLGLALAFRIPTALALLAEARGRA
jgi:putative peptidoglycan lipid II flippase